MKKNLQFYLSALTLFLSSILFAQTTTFNSSGTYTVPAGVTSITVEAWGAGGGGGGGNTANAASGGGGGAYTRYTFTVIPGNTYTINVGTGGATNTAGGNTTVLLGATTVIRAAGGGGGTAAGPAGAARAGGIGGAASGGLPTAGAGLIRTSGGDGGNNSTDFQGGAGGGGSAGTGGNGGNGQAGGLNPSTQPFRGALGGAAGSGTGGSAGSVGGAGGTRTGTTPEAGFPGFVPGSGGGGRSGSTTAASNTAGGTGANGRVIISKDSDGDGITDNLDLDNDNDGILDSAEGSPFKIITTFGFENGQTVPASSTASNPVSNWKSNYNFTGTSVAYTIRSPDYVSDAVNSPWYSVKEGVSFATLQSGTDQPKNGGGDGLGFNFSAAELGALNIQSGDLIQISFRYAPGYNYAAGSVGVIWKADADTTLALWYGNGNIANFAALPATPDQSLLTGAWNPSGTLSGAPIQNDADWKIANLSFTYTGGSVHVAFQGLVGATTVNNEIIYLDDITINSFSLARDTDGDTIPDYLDVDSDNDGCADAVEGSENVGTDQIHSLSLAAGDANYAYRGQIKVLANGATAGTPAQVVSTIPAANGVPSLVNNAANNNGGVAGFADNTDTPPTADIGQGIGSSIDASVSGCSCYVDPKSGTGIPTNHGITLLKRAGASPAQQDNWPMVRNGAFTVLESNIKGFVITRVAGTAGITAPQEGMMVFDTTPGVRCLKIYDGTQWSCFNTPACP